MDVNSSKVALIDDSVFFVGEEETISDLFSNDGGAGRGAHSLGAATRELRRVNRALRRIAIERGGAPDSAADARAIIAARRLCQSRFGPEIGDTAWMLLLEAFTARIEGRRLAVTSFGAAGGITRSTAYRWTRRLLERGLLSAQGSPERGRATFVTLSDAAAEHIRASLAEARSLSSRGG
jgi:DNA-binding transcriptional ArsR family regulator